MGAPWRAWNLQLDVIYRRVSFEIASTRLQQFLLR